MKKRPYEQLIVWQEAHQLCKDVYKLLPQFPPEERFCLCNQMRRSSTSVPTNIVEGNKKRSKKQKLNFFGHSEGSLEELDYQLLLSNELGYISKEQFESFRNHVGRVSYLLTKFRSTFL